jgi:hypothetical protein
MEMQLGLLRISLSSTARGAKWYVRRAGQEGGGQFRY